MWTCCVFVCILVYKWGLSPCVQFNVTRFYCAPMRRLLRVPWTARRSNQSILKEINSEYSLEGLMLKHQYFGHLMRRAISCLEGKGATEDEKVGWHHWLNGHEFEQTLGNSEGQGSLLCFSPWGCKESDVTEWLNNNKVGVGAWSRSTGRVGHGCHNKTPQTGARDGGS